MAHEINRLSSRQVTNLKTPGRHADGNRLYLSVGRQGQRRWVYLYRWKGKSIEMGLGSVKDVTLAHARKKARDAGALLADGVSPLEYRRRLAPSLNFGEFADAWLSDIRSGFRADKHYAFYERVVSKHLAPLRPKQVADITTEDVLDILKPIWSTELDKGGKMETASRTRGILERILDAARVKGYRTGENPARWKGHLKHLLPPRRKLTKGHFAAVPYKDMPDLMRALREADGIGARALELATLCGVRTGDIIGMRWREVDLDRALWTIPKERLKGQRNDHSVPLSPRAVEVLQIMKDMNLGDNPAAFVFPGTKADGGLSDAAMRAVLRRLGRTETVHGMRSALRDWAGNETTFPRELAEEVLAHVVGNEVEQAYRRSEAINKRRALLMAWANFVGGRDNIVAIELSAAS